MKCVECGKELNKDEVYKCNDCSDVMCKCCYSKGGGQCPECENEDCY